MASDIGLPSYGGGVHPHPATGTQQGIAARWVPVQPDRDVPLAISEGVQPFPAPWRPPVAVLCPTVSETDQIRVRQIRFLSPPSPLPYEAFPGFCRPGAFLPTNSANNICNASVEANGTLIWKQLQSLFNPLKLRTWTPTTPSLPGREKTFLVAETRKGVS